MIPRKIAVFTGTRAEYGLLYWLIHDLASDSKFEMQLIVSGAHLSPQYGLTYKEIEKDGFKIGAKIENVLSSDSSVGTAKSLGLGILGYADALDRLKPDALVVLGDRYEALAITQTAAVLRIPVIHLHGGEITEGAYDDAFRHAITKLSTLHVTATEEYRQRVIQLGEAPKTVFNLGAIGLDHLQRSNFMSLSELSESLGFGLDKPYFLATYHPATMADENPFDSITALIGALDEFPDHKVIITLPNADDGRHEIANLIEGFAAINPDRVIAMHSLGQIRYLSAIKYAAAVIGNSSSGIIEVPSFNVPSINIGQRQSGRLAAQSVINCAPTHDAIFAAINKGIEMDKKQDANMFANPYGRGNVSAQIIQFLKSHDLTCRKKFHDLAPQGDP